MAGLEIAAAGDDGPANLGAADSVALLLDGVPSFAADGPGDTSSQDQFPVGGIDDGIGILLGDVPLNQQNLGVLDFHALSVTSFALPIRPG